MESITKLIDVPTQGEAPSMYRGSVRNSILGLKYLAANHPTCRIILTFAMEALQRGENIGWSTFAFKWSMDHDDFAGDGDGVLTVPGVDKARYARVLMHCVSRDPSAVWVAAPITIRSRLGNMHANFLLYHVPSGRIFRFEPYGQTPSEYDGKGLDRALRSFFEPMLPNLQIISSSSEACDMQARQEREAMRHPGLEKGYCQVFALLYASVQMSDPTCSRNAGDMHHLCDVRRTAHEIDRFFRGHDGHITAWVRAYSNFLVSQYKSICERNATQLNISDVQRKDTLLHIIRHCPAQCVTSIC